MIDEIAEAYVVGWGCEQGTEEEIQSEEGLLCTPEVPANSKKTWNRSDGWPGMVSDQILRFIS